jgi:hypothetical protein
MYDPNQPRIPEGHQGGGRWTRGGGYRPLSDLGALPPPERDVDEPSRTQEDDARPYDLYLPSDLDRMRPERGAQYAFLRPRPGVLPVPQVDIPPPPGGPRKSELDLAAIAAGAWRFFRQLSPFNGSDQTAIISFKAGDFRRGNPEFEFEFVRMLNRKETQEVCGDLETVQRLVDEAVDEAGDPKKDHPNLGAYGTDVHSRLQHKVTDTHFDVQRRIMLRRPRHGLEAEVSFAPDGSEGAKTGKRGTIRVDIFKLMNSDTICVYDLKTLNAQLTPERMRKIADYIFRRYGKKIKRIIVVEVKPGEGPAP